MLDAFAGVAGGFKDGLVRPYPHILLCWLFQVVALGYWQTTVKADALTPPG